MAFPIPYATCRTADHRGRCDRSWIIASGVVWGGSGCQFSRFTPDAPNRTLELRRVCHAFRLALALLRCDGRLPEVPTSRVPAFFTRFTGCGDRPEHHFVIRNRMAPGRDAFPSVATPFARDTTRRSLHRN